MLPGAVGRVDLQPRPGAQPANWEVRGARPATCGRFCTHWSGYGGMYARGDGWEDRAVALDPTAEWAASGAMALTGSALGPALGPPALLVDGVAELGRRIAARTAELGQRVELDWLALLGERAA